MAYVIHSLNTTASGLCHHLDSVVDDEHHQYALDLTLSADALIVGRNTFDLFMEFWPAAAGRTDLPKGTLALAKAFHDVAKYVVSSRQVELTWNNTRQIQGASLGNIRSEIRAY